MATNISQLVRGNVVTTVTGNINNVNTTVLPIAKVLPQQQQQQVMSNDPPPIVSVSSVGGAQNVFIHSRSPSNPPNVSKNSSANINISNSQGGSFISAPSGTYYMSASSGAGNPGGIAVSTVLQSFTTNSNTNTTNVLANTNVVSVSNLSNVSGGLVTSMAYAPQAGTFAVVPSSNRNNINQKHSELIFFIFLNKIQLKQVVS